MQQSYTRFIRRRLITLGVSYAEAQQCAQAFQSQVSRMGAEAACSYYKKVGDTLLNYLYGSPERPSWVRVTRSGFPKCLAMLRNYSEEILLRVAKLARVIRLQACSPKQVIKVTTAPRLPYQGVTGAVESMTSLVLEGLDYYYLRDRISEFKCEPDRVANYFTSTLTESASTESYSAPQAAPDVARALEILASVPVLQVPGWEKSLWPLHPSTAQFAIRNAVQDNNQMVGEIHAAQEGGAKLRLFAAPYTIVQCILDPIFRHLAKIRDRIPTDCTLDQLAGARWAQEVLAAGGFIHSVDLTTATCRFPMDPQLALLRALGVPAEYIDALIWACRGDWQIGSELLLPFNSPKLVVKNRDGSVTDHRVGTTLNWVVGQPLGIKPSMVMFAETHNMLLTGICVRLRKVPSECFRVLGDDVIIADSDVNDLYRAYLQDCGVPVSVGKCHNSSYFAEFAGASITRDGWLRPGQWRTVNWQNALSIADSLGVPTYGEVAEVASTLQECFLFLDGRFTPPPERWSWYLKAASMINTIWLERFAISDAPLRYDKCRKIYTRQLERAGMLRSRVIRYYPPEFIYEQVDIAQVAFKPVCTHPKLAEWEDFSLSIRDASKLVGSNRLLAPLAGSQALVIAELAFSRGILDFEEFRGIGETIITNIHSLLYLQPPKGGRERSLNRLMKKLQGVLDFIQATT